MKKTTSTILVIVTSFGFGFLFKTFITKQATSNIPIKQADHTTKKVTGIGGIFFKCKEPKKVKEWYKTHLGFATDQYGARFEWQEGTDTTKKYSLQWSPFSEKTKYFDPSTKEF